MKNATICALVALAFLLGLFPMHDHDTWWHLATARLIVSTHAVPSVDVFTWTADKLWIDLYWLPQLIMLALYSLGGATALVLAKSSACALVAWLGLRAGKRAPSWTLVLAWIPALVLVSGRICERPETVSFILLAAWLAVLGQAPRSPRLLWLLSPLQCLWVNSHGLFVLGPLLLGAYLLAPESQRDRTTALSGLATLAACFVNPYGWRVFAHAWQQFHQLDAGFYRAHIGELQTLGEFVSRNGIGNPYLLALFALAIIGFASFVVAALGRRWSFFRTTLFVGAIALGWQATRLAPVFAIMTALVAVWNFSEAFDGRRGGALPLVVVLSSALLVPSFYAWAGEGRTIGLGEQPRTFAHDACAFLAQPGMPTRVLAYNLGQSAVCAYHLRPEQRQYLIPRIEPVRDGAYESYVQGIVRMVQRRTDWSDSLGIDYSKSAEVPAVLMERGPLDRAVEAMFHDQRWRLTYEDDTAMVFLPAGVTVAPVCSQRHQSQPNN